MAFSIALRVTISRERRPDLSIDISALTASNGRNAQRRSAENSGKGSGQLRELREQLRELREMWRSNSGEFAPSQSVIFSGLRRSAWPVVGTTTGWACKQRRNLSRKA